MSAVKKKRWFRRRSSPYTVRGIRQVPCCRCGEQASFQWNVCADRNAPRALCLACDVALNDMVLRWMGHPEAEALSARYREVMGA